MVAKSVRYVSNRAGLREVLHSSPVGQRVAQESERLAARAGDGFVASYGNYPSRQRGIVYADSYSAMAREARDNILVRVLG